MTKRKADEGEQLDLIPECRAKNAPAIRRLARAYTRAQQARTEALNKEVDAKRKLLAEVRDAGLKPMDDGTIHFRLDGDIEIRITPRDELVRVKLDSAAPEEPEE